MTFLKYCYRDAVSRDWKSRETQQISVVICAVEIEWHTEAWYPKSETEKPKKHDRSIARWDHRFKFFKFQLAENKFTEQYTEASSRRLDRQVRARGSSGMIIKMGNSSLCHELRQTLLTQCICRKGFSVRTCDRRNVARCEVQKLLASSHFSFGNQLKELWGDWKYCHSVSLRIPVRPVGWGDNFALWWRFRISVSFDGRAHHVMSEKRKTFKWHAQVRLCVSNIDSIKFSFGKKLKELVRNWKYCHSVTCKSSNSCPRCGCRSRNAPGRCSSQQNPRNMCNVSDLIIISVLVSALWKCSLQFENQMNFSSGFLSAWQCSNIPIVADFFVFAFFFHSATSASAGPGQWMKTHCSQLVVK